MRHFQMFNCIMLQCSMLIFYIVKSPLLTCVILQYHSNIANTKCPWLTCVTLTRIMLTFDMLKYPLLTCVTLIAITLTRIMLTFEKSAMPRPGQWNNKLSSRDRLLINIIIKHVQYISIRDWSTESSSWVCYTNTVPYLFKIFECFSLLYRH